MGDAMGCTAGDGEPAVYMITDMVNGGNTLVCAGHWLDLCASMVAAAGETAPPVPEPAGPVAVADGAPTGPDGEPGTTGEPVDPGKPAGLSPSGPSGAGAGDTDEDGPSGFAPDTVARALADDIPAPDARPKRADTPPRPPGRPRKPARP